MGKGLNTHLSKDYIQMDNKLNIIHHLENANQSQNEIQPHSRMALTKKQKQKHKNRK